MVHPPMDDASHGSISQFFLDLRLRADPDAANVLWERFFPRLMGLARRVLDGRRLPSSAEDAVQEAFSDFFQRVSMGKVSDDIRDRDDLWRVLSTMTVQRARKQLRKESAQRRGDGRVYLQSQLEDSTSKEGPLSHALAQMPTAEWDMVFYDLMSALSDELREVAIMRLARFTNEEIKTALGCSLRSVERRLQLIRATWSEIV
jgi:RNA polymerase sigma factor (sigma-70 family)